MARMQSRGRILLVAGLLVALVLVALVLVSRRGPRPADQVPVAGAPRAPDAPSAPPPQTAEERAKYVPPPNPPVPRPLVPDDAGPPPVSALILTFPDGTDDAKIQALYAKCGLTELRRSRQMARVGWDAGKDLAAVQLCLKWEEVQVTEERDPNAPR